HVTGVQTCALPILLPRPSGRHVPLVTVDFAGRPLMPALRAPTTAVKVGVARPRHVHLGLTATSSACHRIHGVNHHTHRLCSPSARARSSLYRMLSRTARSSLTPCAVAM